MRLTLSSRAVKDNEIHSNVMLQGLLLAAKRRELPIMSG
jgi:hypothetical protein